MKVFQICNKSPYPPKEGGSIAMNNITQGLIMHGHQIKILAFSTPKNYVDEKTFPEKYKNKTNIETVFIDNTIKLTDAFFNLFSNESYHIKRFISKEFENKIINILLHEKFDIIQLETLYITPYIETIRKYSDAKIVLRSHNIEHFIWSRMRTTCKNPFKKIYLRHLINTLKSYEINALNRCDGIASITSNDAECLKTLGCRVPVIDIPLGIEADNYIQCDVNNTEIPSIFHIGSMNWMPNEEAVKWFLKKVWNDVIIEFPKIKLYLAGHQMPAWLTNKVFPNTIVIGEVEDAATFMNTKQIMIVPLLSGSGLRVKIIEGMALGKTIISTSIGAEGIDYENGKHLLIANTPVEFVQQIKKCVNDKKFTEYIGNNAKQWVKEKYDNNKITDKLIDFYKQLLK